jgi:hypothetical protein
MEHDVGMPAAHSCELCMAFETLEQTGEIAVTGLAELSGLAASRKNPGIFFGHDDHDRTTVYAFDLQGQSHAHVELPSARASDVEDIAVGPCDQSTCVYLADIGDNASARSEYAVLRYREPEVPASAGDMAINAEFERFAFRYPTAATTPKP